MESPGIYGVIASSDDSKESGISEDHIDPNNIYPYNYEPVLSSSESDGSI